MKNQILVKRYTQGLIDAIRDEEEYASMSRELSEFHGMLKERPRLHKLLTRPFLPASRKKSLAESVLNEVQAGKKLIRLILLLIDRDRTELLPDIIESLPEAWNLEKGILTFEVASVIPLTGEQKKNLQQRLERLTSGPVALNYLRDPSLVGGLRLRKGNMVYDVSIQGDLEKLQEHIIEG